MIYTKLDAAYKVKAKVIEFGNEYPPQHHFFPPGFAFKNGSFMQHACS